MVKRAYIPKSKKQEHLTPDRIYEIIEEKWGWTKDEMYDPFPPGTPYKAPIFFNAFYGPWWDVNYVNSPYEKETLEKAVQKAHDESYLGKETIMLCPAKTDQGWFHDIILKYEYQIVWIRRRLKFKNNKDSAGGSHFLVRIA